MECQKSNNKKRCNCTYNSCPRKGICCECLRYHLQNDELPACCFSKEAEKPMIEASRNSLKQENNSHQK